MHYVLGLITQLYDIEDEVHGRSDAERLAARQERSLPVMKRLEEYLREQKGLALPKSQFGKAIDYALNQWEALLLYASDGRLEIDNNSSERTLRPCAIGRKNWMFFGSDRGGETAAILMSILAGAKRHGIEPFEYVRQLLIALSSADVDLRSLLPDVWIAAHPEHFLQYRHDEAEAAARARKRRREKRRASRRSGSPGAGHQSSRDRSPHPRDERRFHSVRRINCRPRRGAGLFDVGMVRPRGDRRAQGGWPLDRGVTSDRSSHWSTVWPHRVIAVNRVPRALSSKRSRAEVTAVQKRTRRSHIRPDLPR